MRRCAGPLPCTVDSEPSPTDVAAGFTYVIDWGDGQTETIGPGAGALVTVQHGFATLGRLTVEVTIMDKDGAASTDTLDVNVEPVARIGNDIYIGDLNQPK